MHVITAKNSKTYRLQSKLKQTEQTDMQTDRQTDRQTDGQTNKQANKQTTLIAAALSALEN
jgi:hypothetical protein